MNSNPCTANLAKTEQLDTSGSLNAQNGRRNFCCRWRWEFKKRNRFFFLIFHFDKQDESGSETGKTTPCPQSHCCAPDFPLILSPLCHTQISLFNIQVDLQIAFRYEFLSLWRWPLNTFIRAKNSFANETQRSAALPHRETGCLPIVRAAWERRGSSAQPGPAHLSRLKADPV